MRIAVVDDSEADRGKLAGGINKYLEKNGVWGSVVTYESGMALLDGWQENRVDVVFLDIYMEPLDGMETARRIREKDRECLIVFTTTSAEHAVESFRVRAFDYLLKPYSNEQLEEVLRLCFDAVDRGAKYIEVVSKRVKLRVRLSDIRYSDVDGHYIMLHTRKTVIRTRMQFEQFAPLLLSDKRFLNCYRNCIINMDEVSSMEDYDFLMKDGEKIPITKAKATAIKQAYASYAFDVLQHNA
ncbi:LytTR family DNA-binding domain-containing protein [Christensenellaceae bacterium OttesenSCG-928-K19]|nr:LytTR family DNA-binding domain-containing protein [Christensenellaceae bacterium OttesenSCG-928-K19]